MLAVQLRPDAELHRPRDPRWPLLIPIAALHEGERAVIGALALGPRRSEEPYVRVSIDLLLALADRTGTSVAVAQLVAHQLSPAGRADTLARALALAPDAALADIHQLAQNALTSAEQAATLAALPGALRHADQATLAELATGYRLLVEGRGDRMLLVTGLRTLSSTPAVGAAAAHRYQLCCAALERPSVDSLLALAPAVQALTAQKSVPAPLILPPSEMLTPFQAVLDTCAGLARQTTIGGRIACLQQAQEQLELLEGRLPDTLDLVARLVSRAITRHWGALVEHQTQALRGRAHLELRLITGSVVEAEEITLALELTNQGLGSARHVILGIRLEEGHVVNEPEVRLDELPAGEVRLCTFVLRPMWPSALRPTFQLTYQDAAGDQAPHMQALAVAVVTAPPWRAPLPNPYIAGAPLRAGSRVFIGREDDIAVIGRAVSRPTPTALILTGQRRMGKTSLLQQLSARLTPGLIAVYLDGQRLALNPALPRLFATMATRIAQALALPPPDPSRFAAEPAAHFADTFVPTTLDALGDRRLLLLLDEIEALEERSAQGQLHPAFFGYLRHLMQHEPRLALVCAGAHRLDELRPVAWTGIFNAALHHRIGGLSDDDARALITAPLSDALRYDELALNRLLRLSGGHPYFLQLLCQTLVDAANTQRQSIVTLEQVLAVREQVLELGEAPLADLWSDSSADEQAVLVMLARTLPLTTTRSAGRLVESLRTGGLGLEPSQIVAGLQRLAWRDILAVAEDGVEEGGLRYRWRLGLLSAWVARTQARTV
jgi:hypothetical protein